MDDPESDDEDEPMANRPPPAKRLSVVVKGKPKLSHGAGGDASKRRSTLIVRKDKLRSDTTHRMPGSGFDSEMEDAEAGPITEEEIVFRMMEGPECDYISECLTNKKFPSGESMTFKLKWLVDRRAVVNVNNQLFAAVLVDLPTVTEATKTWDKKLVVKAADICQMLLAFAKVSKEEEAQTVPLPKVLFDGYRWPHGLTPPMHDAVHRRFRKRLHKSDILNKEQEVNRLLEADKKAINTRFEYVSERRDTLQFDTPGGEVDADGEEDAEGEDEEIEDQGEDIDDSALQAEFEAAFNAVPAADTAGASDATPMDLVETPAAAVEGQEGQGDEDELFGGDGESGEDYDEDDEESDEDLDQAERERREEIRSVREEIREIDKRIKKMQGEFDAQKNPLLKRRLLDNIKGAKEDKRLKLASIGERASDDEED